MLDKKILNEIHTIVDELYPAKQMLKKYKNEPDAPIGLLMSLTTRVKIYDNVQELIRRYKKGQDYTALLNRIFHQLKLHRYQVRKLSHMKPSVECKNVHRFCVALVSLLHIVFRKKIPD